MVAPTPSPASDAEALRKQLMASEQEVEALRSELAETNQGVVALYAELDDRAAQLREAIELKGRFLSYMSHEFRTPLTSKQSLSGILLARLDGPADRRAGDSDPADPALSQ